MLKRDITVGGVYAARRSFEFKELERAVCVSKNCPGRLYPAVMMQFDCGTVAEVLVDDVIGAWSDYNDMQYARRVLIALADVVTDDDDRAVLESVIADLDGHAVAAEMTFSFAAVSGIRLLRLLAGAEGATLSLFDATLKFDDVAAAGELFAQLHAHPFGLSLELAGAGGSECTLSATLDTTHPVSCEQLLTTVNTVLCSDADIICFWVDVDVPLAGVIDVVGRALEALEAL